MTCSPGMPAASAAAARSHRTRGQPAARARAPGRGLRHRVRRPGDGRARRTGRGQRAAREHHVDQPARQHRPRPSATSRACATSSCTSRASMISSGDLIAAAERVTGDARTVLYEFALWSETQPLAPGARQHRDRCGLRRTDRARDPRVSSGRRALVTGGSGGIGGGAVPAPGARRPPRVRACPPRPGQSPSALVAEIQRRGRRGEPSIVLRHHRRRRHARARSSGARGRSRSRSWSTMPGCTMMRCCRA